MFPQTPQRSPRRLRARQQVQLCVLTALAGNKAGVGARRGGGRMCVCGGGLLPDEIWRKSERQELRQAPARRPKRDKNTKKRPFCTCERGGLRLHTESFRSPEALGGRHVLSGKLIVTWTREKKKKRGEEPRRCECVSGTKRRRRLEGATLRHGLPRHLSLALPTIWTGPAGFGNLSKWSNKVNLPAEY